MSISFKISNEQEAVLRNAWGSGLDRAALEALAIEVYRAKKFGAAEIGRLLGLEDRWVVNKWLAERQVPLNYTSEDLEADRKAHERVLGKSA